MKGFWQVLRAVLAVTIMLPIGLALAQKSLSQVPITYAGDTDKTILRRAQWIEAAKKEGTLAWWGTSSPAEGKKLTTEFNKIYPFITVNYWRGKGEEVAAKLEAEIAGGRSSVDITLGGEPYNYPRWRKMEGLPLVYRTEEGEIKSIELALDKRFAQLLGVTME